MENTRMLETIPGCIVPAIHSSIGANIDPHLVPVSGQRRPLLAILSARIEHWCLGGSPFNDAESLLARLNRMTNGSRSGLLPQMKIIILRTVANAWHTSRRYSRDILPCPFGCGRLRSDDLRHSAHCHNVARAFHSAFPSLASSAMCDVPLRSFLCLDHSISESDLVGRALLLDGLCYAHGLFRTRCCSLSGPLTTSAVTSRIVALARSCPAVGVVVSQLRSRGRMDLELSSSSSSSSQASSSDSSSSDS